MTQTKVPNSRAGRPIIVAVDDPLLHPEVTHLAAAAGHAIVDVADPTTLPQYVARAFAVLVDATWAPHLPPPRADNVFIVSGSLADASASPDAFVLPAQAGDLLVALGRCAQASQHSGGGRTIAVLGAGGGVGASVLACALAEVGGNATLIDAHRLSGGLDLLLGVEERPGARWGEIVLGDGAVARTDVRRALPSTASGTAVLTFARSTVADPFRVTTAELERLCRAVGDEGLTVLDVPIDLLPAACDLAVIVVTPTVRSVCAAQTIALECNAAGVEHVLVLRDSPWQGIDDDGVVAVTRSRICHRLPTLHRLPRSIESAGLPARLPKPLRKAADAVLAEVA